MHLCRVFMCMYVCECVCVYLRLSLKLAWTCTWYSDASCTHLFNITLLHYSVLHSHSVFLKILATEAWERKLIIWIGKLQRLILFDQKHFCTLVLLRAGHGMEQGSPLLINTYFCPPNTTLACCSFPLLYNAPCLSSDVVASIF